jgi:NADH-quinone oxidoreductase subunit J
MPPEALETATFGLSDLAFWLVAGLTLAGAAWAVLSRNIVRSVFALLGAFLGVAGLYASLAADFLAVIQVLVYVGGILVLLLFAVMLTSRIELAPHSNRAGGPLAWLLAAGLAGSMGVVLIGLALRTPWVRAPEPLLLEPTTADLGHILLGPGLLPFELLGVVLLAVVVGSVVVARREGGGP